MIIQLNMDSIPQDITCEYIRHKNYMTINLNSFLFLLGNIKIVLLNETKGS